MKKILLVLVTFGVFSCKKKDETTPTPTTPSLLVLVSSKIDNITASINSVNYNTKLLPIIRLTFNNALDKSSVNSSVVLKDPSASAVPIVFSYENNDSTLVVTPSNNLKGLSTYVLSAETSLKSKQGGNLYASSSISFATIIDSADKFPRISDDALLDTVQRRTFKYFWDFGHPVSGLARERNNSGEIVTSGGSGFGIMSIPVAISRNFITRTQGLARMQTIVSFLKNTATKHHGAFSHWLNGTSGAVVPFSTKDDGADLVETSYLMMGLLTARQYFNGTDATETTLRNDITTLYNNVEWDWFRKSGSNTLYWHWSPNYGWDMNMPIGGYDEALIVYILAASSTTHGIPKTVYTNGWAKNGAMVNGASYYGITLPLGEAYGGPLFYEQYTYLGVDPRGLSDTYANYQTQVTNHTLINYQHCVNNPNNWYGYSNSCWGLTASDIQGGYTASSPTNDKGFIAPTAALSSMPYTPTESMRALKFFYYTMGDKLFKDYGFVDAFSLKAMWFADSYLAIDQGPIIGMIENYRTGLLWNLFTSCPEIKNGMKNVLNFSAPYL